MKKQAAKHLETAKSQRDYNSLTIQAESSATESLATHCLPDRPSQQLFKDLIESSNYSEEEIIQMTKMTAEERKIEIESVKKKIK